MRKCNIYGRNNKTTPKNDIFRLSLRILTEYFEGNHDFLQLVTKRPGVGEETSVMMISYQLIKPHETVRSTLFLTGKNDFKQQNKKELHCFVLIFIMLQLLPRPSLRPLESVEGVYEGLYA